MKFIPLYDRILVKVLEGQKEIGGFAMPDNSRDDFLMGSIISIGAGYRKENGDMVPLLVKSGFVAMFGPYAGTKIQVEGQQYLTMKEGELVGFLCNDPVSPCGVCFDCTKKAEHADTDRGAAAAPRVCIAADESTPVSN